MTPTTTAPGATTVRVPYDEVLALTARILESRGVPRDRADAAAEALCYGDLTGLSSHGLANLTRLYLPLFDDGRVVPAAEPRVLADRGAAVLADGNGALGLWAASWAVDLAAERAATHGVGMVSMRNATHFGCAGYHAARAVTRGMVGLVASNCGRQRIARPPGGRVAMLGTNPLSLAAPAGPHHPFVLDMSTTVVPTGRVRAAARAGQQVPHGWLEDDHGQPVTDPAGLDDGRAHLLWLGGAAETGAYKGYGLGLLVEVLAAMVAGAGMGPEPAAFAGDGGPSGRDDDIGVLALAVAPATLRPAGEVAADAARLFGTLLDCPPVDPDSPVRYPGWREAERAAQNLRDGVPLTAQIYGELRVLADDLGLAVPAGGAA